MFSRTPPSTGTAKLLVPSPHVCLLGSHLSQGWNARFSHPQAIFRCKDRLGTLIHSDGRSEARNGDPFQTLEQLLAEKPGLVAAGYWSYDLRYELERLPRKSIDDLLLPDCWVGLYPESHPVADEFLDSVLPDALSGVPGASRYAPVTTIPGPLTRYSTRASYEAAVAKVLEYIRAGDCYQVNLSQRFSTPLAGSPWELSQRLQHFSPAPYSAYLDCGDHQVISSSPELFLRIEDGRVETRPIKGTRPRGPTPEVDRAAAAELLASEKDAAELLMIVDLERNDLGRVCRYGSVHVPQLRQLESYANVHHLMATVKGELRPEVTPLQALRAAFPGGSITGAPKIRAMEIIEELEEYRRGVYTGAIGWVDGRGRGEWNIAIRTMVVTGGKVYFNVGGGIVADSNPAEEYAETLAKAQGMLRALQLTNGAVEAGS